MLNHSYRPNLEEAVKLLISLTNYYLRFVQNGWGREKDSNQGLLIIFLEFISFTIIPANGRPRIKQQCRKTAVLSWHRFLINSGVKKQTTFKYGLEL